MAMALDPYYYTRDLMDTNQQQRALGQSKGFSPSDISRIASTNFAAQQESEVTNRKLALSEREVANQEKSVKDASKAAMFQGGTNLALQAPKAITGYRDIYREWGGGAKGNAIDPNATATGAKDATQALTSMPQQSVPGLGTTMSGTTATPDLFAEPSAAAIGKPALPAQFGPAAAPPAGLSPTEMAGGAFAGATAGYNLGRQFIHGKHSAQYATLLSGGGAALGLMFPEIAAGVALASVVSGMIHW